jgi:hypothetical protein
MPWISQKRYNELLSLAGLGSRLKAVENTLSDGLTRVYYALNIQTEEFMALSGEFADLEQAVAANTDTGASAKAALEMLAAKIEAGVQGAADLAEAKAKAAQLAQQLRTNSETLANAILRTDGDPSNDPSAPPSEGGGPFNPSGQAG